MFALWRQPSMGIRIASRWTCSLGSKRSETKKLRVDRFLRKVKCQMLRIKPRKTRIIFQKSSRHRCKNRMKRVKRKNKNWQSPTQGMKSMISVNKSSSSMPHTMRNLKVCQKAFLINPTYLCKNRNWLKVYLYLTEAHMASAALVMGVVKSLQSVRKSSLNSIRKNWCLLGSNGKPNTVVLWCKGKPLVALTEW